MGSATSKKSILSKKVIILLVSLMLTGIIMRSLSPAHKLDSRAYYTFEMAITYLAGLPEAGRQNYLLAEYFDFWFVVNYSWLLFLAFRKYVPRKELFWMAFIPGLLDLFETGLIAQYLYLEEFNSFHQLLPIFSSLKWLLGLIILIYVAINAFWRRAKL